MCIQFGRCVCSPIAATAQSANLRSLPPFEHLAGQLYGRPTPPRFVYVRIFGGSLDSVDTRRSYPRPSPGLSELR